MVADAYDNAMAEAFVGTLKIEMVDGQIYRSRFDAELAVAICVGWLNSGRIHENLGYVTPDEFEANYLDQRSPTDESQIQLNTAASEPGRFRTVIWTTDWSECFGWIRMDSWRGV